MSSRKSSLVSLIVSLSRARCRGWFVRVRDNSDNRTEICHSSSDSSNSHFFKLKQWFFFLLLLLLFFHFLDRFLLNFLASSIHFPLLCFVSFPLLSRPLLGVRPFPANLRRIFSPFFPHCERALKRFSASFTKIPRRGKRSISYKFLSLFIRVMAFLRCFFFCVSKSAQ